MTDKPKIPMTPDAASRIQSNADRAGHNQDFKARAQSAAARNSSGGGNQGKPARGAGPQGSRPSSAPSRSGGGQGKPSQGGGGRGGARGGKGR